MGVGIDPLVSGGGGHPVLAFTPMRAEDLEAVMEIERGSFSDPWTPGLFLHELKVPFSKTVLARAVHGSAEILGYVCRWLVGDEMHILNLAVRPDRRTRGIGRRLVEWILEDAASTQAQLITLEVRPENAAAVALYRGFGFTERGLRRHYYGRGQHALIMTRSLTAEAETPTAAAR